MTGWWRKRFVALAILITWVTSGCVHIVRHAEVLEVPLSPESAVETPSKLQLSDGSVVLFPDGLWVHADTVWGREPGQQFNLSLSPSSERPFVPTTEVASAVTVEQKWDVGSSLLLSLGGSAVVVGLWAIAISGGVP